LKRHCEARSNVFKLIGAARFANCPKEIASCLAMTLVIILLSGF
jgi:hypothetical protein